jgi:GTP pyrophosphokinase
MMVRLSRCCTPVPGDEIVGFVTQGRGVSVHRGDCANAVALSSGSEGRMIDVEWDRERPSTFVASIEVKALDRPRLLADVTRILAEHHVNILTSTSHAGNDRVSKMRFEFELADAAHLESLLASLKRVDGVYDAYRLLPGGGATRERAANGARRPAQDGSSVEGAAPDGSSVEGAVPEAASAAASSSDPGE